MPILGVVASSISGNLYSASYESIATINVGAGGTSSVTFSSIPQTYTHLQLRMLSRNSFVGTFSSIEIQFNSDTSSAYAWHYVSGNGSTTPVGAATSDNVIRAINFISASQIANAFSVYVMDILDYTNTNKNTTTRTLGGGDCNGSGSLNLASGLWMSTNAITSIKLTASNSGNLVQNSQFALYGIKGVV
jgi:hypothetical protein